MTKQKTNKLPYPAQVRGLNFYKYDKVLQNFLERSAPDLLERRHKDLSALGDFCASELDEQAEYSDRIHPPVWKYKLDDLMHPGKRRGKLYLNKCYEDCHQEIYKRGFIASVFEEGNAETHLYAFIAQYLISQADISIGCPFAMTHPVALIMAHHAPAALREKFLFQSIRKDGKTKTGGTWATEKHSGSDIARTETRAIYQTDGTVRLYGQKWFTSNAGSGLVIATARPEDAPEGGKGLGLYLVPSHIDDHWQVENDYELTHLKEKIGTRALATGEILLEGALAFEITPPPNGLRVMMEALRCSRIHNAMAAAGVMRRVLCEALCWTSHRKTFGKNLIDQPLVMKRLLDLTVEWIAGFTIAFEAALSFDEALKDDVAYIWSRLVTALAKYKTAEQAVWCAQKALCLVAGNGYTEDYPIARQFRDAMVLPVWEGPEQIQALELIRMISGKEAGDKIFLEKLNEISSQLASAGLSKEKTNLDALIKDMKHSLETLRAKPEQSEFMADEFLQCMSHILIYALLCRDACWDVQKGEERVKSLVCDYFYRSIWDKELVPSLSSCSLKATFDTLVPNCLFPLFSSEP